MQRKFLITGVLPVLLLLVSCGVPKNFKNAVYLKDTVAEAQRSVIYKPTLIMPGDRLNITVTAINKEAAEAFNMPASGDGGLSGYLVDSSGNIQLLQLGTLHVKDLTTVQVKDTIEHLLQPYLKGSVVTVAMANFKIHIMGEVATPGTIEVTEGKINILEALSQSGDLTIFAKRDSILVVRETNGKREFGRLNLSSNKIFESPYFNLQQNDIVYVEPDKTKFIANDAVTNRNIRNLGILLTLLSTALLLQNLFK